MKKAFFLLFFAFFQIHHAQQTKTQGIVSIKNLVDNDSIDLAEFELNKRIRFFKKQKEYDSLVNYIHLVSEIELLKKSNSINKTYDLINLITTNSKKPKTVYQLYKELALLSHNQGKIKEAYKYSKKSKIYAEKLSTKKHLVEAEYYLAEYGMRLGDFNLLQKHTNNAHKIIKTNPEKDIPIASKVFNFKAMLMYFSAKLDSSNYYFNKSITSLNKLEKTPENKYYLRATVFGNWTLLKQSQGNYKEAMEFSQQSAKSFKKFLNVTKNHPLSNKAKTNLSIAYRNIGSLYYDLGDMEKYLKFADIAYRFVQKNFNLDTYQYFNGELLMAEANISAKKYKTSLKHLDLAKKSLSEIVGDNFLYNAQLYSIYGNAYFGLDLIKKSIKNFELSNFYYKKTHEGGYSRDQFFQTLDLASAYAEIGQNSKSKNAIKKAQGYLKTNAEDHSYLFNASLLTSAQIAFQLREYNELLELTEKSLNIYKNQKNTNAFNKSHFEENKAEVLLLNTKAKYHLTISKNKAELEGLLSNLNKAIDILEEKKSIISTLKNVNNLIENNKNVFDFSKKINLELYNLTKNKIYLDKLIELNESSLYNRIRARLNIKDDIKFSGISNTILQREKKLRKRLLEANNDDQTFIKSINEWNTFLDSLKQNFPKYHKMRYATINRTLNVFQNNLSENTTIVRYLFIEDKLYAFIATKSSKEIVALNFETIKDDLYFDKNQFKIEKINSKLYDLYKHLWKPFEEKITTDNVIIIPDGALFNLSFEILTPTKINTIKDLVKNSLLTKYNISYNYSLLLLNNKNEARFYANDFVAFTPEFTNKMKSNYKINITDSIDLDKTYLTLLPQPFSKDIAKKYTQLFKGASFTNEKASKQVFSKEANEHKIIHIGTHAESNNVNPELSRLIFAKNISDTTNINDNYLYTYEIYNQNLNSNLAILTACETGKPTYQAGEGMISLAHAFNYAGSESILTSLWKIDEQSSTKIISSFYNYLADGLPKDKALQKAKLDYIATAEGRTISPQYWAGLVLIGDTSPININTPIPLWVWATASLTLLILILLFIKKKK